MKKIIISLLVVASVSAFTYVSLCDYISANICRGYIIAHQDLLQWHPAEFPSRNRGGCFVLPMNNYGMGHYTDMTIQIIDSNSCDIIAWSDRSRFVYRWKSVDRVFVIEDDSLLMSVIKNKIPKDTVIAVSYSLNKTAAIEMYVIEKAQYDSLRKSIEAELSDTIRAIIAKSHCEEDIMRAKIMKLRGEIRMRELRLRFYSGFPLGILP